MMIDPDDQDDVELDVASSSHSDDDISGECEARGTEIDERPISHDTFLI